MHRVDKDDVIKVICYLFYCLAYINEAFAKTFSAMTGYQHHPFSCKFILQPFGQFNLIIIQPGASPKQGIN